MLRILARPKRGKRNAVTEQLYSALESGAGVRVEEWTPGRMLRCSYDILHIHWPNNILTDRRWLRSAVKVLLLQLALGWVRLWGRKVVWTAHDIVSHDQYHPRLEAHFWRFLMASLSGVICLSAESLAQLHARRPAAQRIPALVAPHGTYRGVYPNTATRAEARRRLNLTDDATVILNLGNIRPYKKLERLIELARENPALCVVLAGRVDAIDRDYAAGLQQLAQPLDNVQLHLGYIPDPELQYYLNAADVFVLPYDQISNSGSAILSLSFNLPALAPELPCFIALQKRFGAGWVSTYRGRFDSARMQDYFANAGRHPRPEIDWADYQWDAIAPQVRGFFESLAQNRTPQAGAAQAASPKTEMDDAA